MFRSTMPIQNGELYPIPIRIRIPLRCGSRSVAWLVTNCAQSINQKRSTDVCLELLFCRSLTDAAAAATSAASLCRRRQNETIAVQQLRDIDESLAGATRAQPGRIVRTPVARRQHRRRPCFADRIRAVARSASSAFAAGASAAAAAATATVMVMVTATAL
jgi:hypothetical protein